MCHKEHCAFLETRFSSGKSQQSRKNLWAQVEGEVDPCPHPVLHHRFQANSITTSRKEHFFKKHSLVRMSRENLYTLRPRKHFLVRLSTAVKEQRCLRIRQIDICAGNSISNMDWTTPAWKKKITAVQLTRGLLVASVYF